MSQRAARPELKLGDFFEPTYTVGPDGLPVFNLFSDGKWTPSATGRTFDAHTPIDGSVIARVQSAGVEDVERTVDAAYEARAKIRDMPAIQRIETFQEAGELLLEHMHDFATVLTLEAGKPRPSAEGEVRAAADRMELTMQEARKIFDEYLPGDWAKDTLGKVGLVIREPIGVVAAISPFNYPLFISAAKVVPALLSGNAVVAKPPSDAPLSLLLLGRALEAAGIPSGTFNVVTGRGGEVGDALVSNPKVGGVSFTGSTEVGKHIASIAGVRKQHLELGGKGVAIVLDDADLRLAAVKCVHGSLSNAGQRCDAVSAIIMLEDIAETFVQLVLQEVDTWKLGDPREPSTTIGPVINERAAQRIHALVEEAVQKGARLLRGGAYEGCYYQPTVLDHVPLEAKIAWEETFGPVVTLIRVKDEDEAIAIANKPLYGLDSCVFSTSFYGIWKIAKRLQVGGVTVNDFPRHGVGFFPFGGWKESGVGREGVGYSIEEMTNIKTIVFNLEPAKLGKVWRDYL